MGRIRRIGPIERLLSEAASYLGKGDAAQASEKLYKAAEECVKALAERFNLEEVKAADERGRWTVTLLDRAVRRLTGILGSAVLDGWDKASYLHVWGFHEGRLDVEAVKLRVPSIERLVEAARKALS